MRATMFGQMPSPRRIDVHFHHIPPFYREAVYAAGRGPAIGRYPDWSPEIALDLMDARGIEVALTSLAQPGVGFGARESAQALARCCNDFAAELMARWPARFGAFATVPMGSMDGACKEIAYALDALRFDGVSLFASYGEKFLGDREFDPVLEMLDARGAVVFIHPGLHRGENRRRPAGIQQLRNVISGLPAWHRLARPPPARFDSLLSPLRVTGPAMAIRRDEALRRCGH